MSPEYLTSDQIASSLKSRKGRKSVEQFRLEIEARTGMRLSYSHLVNMMRWDSRTKRGRPPNEVVLKYMGATAKVYQIDGTGAKKNKK